MAAPYSPHDTSVRQPSTPVKELTIENAIPIFVEYLTYDANNVQQMYSFVSQYPWVLTEPAVCEAIVGDPNCYNTLKQTGWWDQVLALVPGQEEMATLWFRKNHVLALAYEATDIQLEKAIDWPAWEMLVEEHGPLHQVQPSDPDTFFRTRAFVALANRIGVNLAPLMCAAMHVLLPMEDMEKTVGSVWSPLQKAQFGWLMEKSAFVGDISPSTATMKSMLRQAQQDMVQWKSLVPANDLSGLAVVYDLNNHNLDDTIFELIQLNGFKPNTDALDYTVALGSNEP